MSYDICLYKPEFLQRAIEQQLGDWTNADPLTEDEANAVIQSLVNKGYIEQFNPWNTGRNFRHPDSVLLIEAGVYRGEVSFRVEYGDAAERAVAIALADAREVATLGHLAVYDPQVGEIEE